MISSNWLVSYRDEKIVALVLKRLAERISRPTPLSGGLTELQRNKEGFEKDCTQFLEEGIVFTRNFDQNPKSSPKTEKNCTERRVKSPPT